jgi:hypothetical protein
MLREIKGGERHPWTNTGMYRELEYFSNGPERTNKIVVLVFKRVN